MGPLHLIVLALVFFLNIIVLAKKLLLVTNTFQPIHYFTISSPYFMGNICLPIVIYMKGHELISSGNI